MALKPDRNVLATDINFYFKNTSDRGVVLSILTAGSGTDIDSVTNEVGIEASPSGARPRGVLLNDFVSQDLSRFPLNDQKDEAASGSKASLLTKGECVTDQVVGNPAPGDRAVLHDDGKVSGVAPADLGTWNQAANPQVGSFITDTDENSFARIYVDL